MIENLRGGKKQKVRSNIVEESKPMSPIERLQLLFPGVDSAWKSKLDSTFAKAIVKSQQLPKYGNGEDMRVLAQIRTSLEEDPANTRYLHHFGIDFTALFLKFNDTYVYTSKVTHPKRVPHPQIETKN